ncbi:MAG TPA: beta-eliminating lyase-related protein [Casimicrobiaceae bacterium]|nr:beta-eliminating lyase-related protein [Casimicrobiaceae bacterium]
MNFCSDNVTGIHPRILDALIAGNGGEVMPYGADPYTRRAEARLCAVFERDHAVAMMTTGTAANALALSIMASPVSAIFCRSGAHLQDNEAGASLMYTGGARIVGIDGRDGLIEPGDLDRALGGFDAARMLSQPAVVSVTQASELGTVYSLQHLRDIGEVCRRHGVRLHMDGARFANALARLGCQPAEMSWRAGVDVLSFGATKNGAMAADAVLVFDPALAASLRMRQKRGGLILSKHRFLGIQLDAYLADDLWLDLARTANARAAELALGLAPCSHAQIVYPVEANEVFVRLPESTLASLEAKGFQFYRRGHGVIRLVTACTTSPADVASFVAAVAESA